MQHDLKQRLKNGETITGSFITMGSPDVTEIIAMAGFDFLVIDTEHGPMSVESALHLVRASEVRGVPAVLRVTNAHDTTILRALDIGAAGVQVPQVNTAAAAREVVEASHYHPVGHRGLAMPRAADYGALTVKEYFQRSLEQTLVIAQCESAEGLENIEAVAEVPGIDVIFLGPFDLSHSLGIPGEVEDPRIKEAERRIVEVCERNGKAAGIFAVNGAAGRQRIMQGFRYVTVATDALLLTAAAGGELKTARGE